MCLETTAREQLREADVVFRGQVVSVEALEPLWRKLVRKAQQGAWDLLGRSDRFHEVSDAWVNGPYYGKLVVLQVHRSWKGAPEGSRVTIRTGMDGDSCAVQFRQGMTYLVYGYRGERWFHTSVCVRTAEIQWAVQDVRELNSLVAPVPEPRVEPRGRPTRQ
jgi:hypothetical protein